MSMTREEAVRRIKETPRFIAAPCPRCGATTVAEAEKMCRPTQSPCGEYSCGTPDDAPETGGMLHQMNPVWAELDGYLWGWMAVDEGFTQNPPTWRDEASHA